jgi:glucose-6-phosphate 1-dehydrogenase
MKQIVQPLTIFLIGATGDLAKKKILKALYFLHTQDLLPAQFTLIGNARSAFSRQEFQHFVKELVKPQDEHQWHAFAESLFYVSGDVSEVTTFEQLRSFHDQLSPCGNHLWYVATLPSLYQAVVANIKQVGLEQTNCGWTKLLLEKPFGTDTTTAQQLNDQLLEVFAEDQIFRIDHFLAKETVQNLLVFRFANGMYEHLWSNSFIDHIQITAAETLGIAGREAFYDGTGALRDVVQNHVIQMMATTLMEEPSSLEPEAVRQQRQALLKAVRLAGTVDDSVEFGQYQTGVIDGETIVGYQQEHPQLTNSSTETAVALKVEIDNDRWRGVPIYLRAGKRLQRSVTEISIVFKEPVNKMFKRSEEQIHNVLTFRIQPNEAVIVRVQVKKPGLALDVEQVPMQFCFETEFQVDLIEAYVKLIYDAVVGDPTFFPKAEEIETSWQIIQPILDAIQQGHLQPQPYVGGSWGPATFTTLITNDGRDWITPSVDVCQLPPAKLIQS